jgi:homoserine O-acetyltransferase
MAYESWGQPNRDRSNAVLLLHGFSGDSHAAGGLEPGHPTPGWWDPLIGPGRALDTDHFWVICPNVFGGCQGSSGPASLDADGQRYGHRFPGISIRDQVACELALADQLGIGSWHAVIGGSMGGMRALEWALLAPERVPRLGLLATAAAASAPQMA